jgi:DNA polymerase
VSALDPARRAHYLAALGIDQFVERRSAAPVAAVAGVTAVAPMASAVAAEPAAHLPGAQPIDWAAFRAEVAACRRCGLCETRTQTVFGVGDTTARWMVIGEAPGAEEDRQGEPFVGRAGQLLTAMLKAIDLPRESVFIANVLKCRPPGNRDPRPDEVAECLPYLERQVAAIRPKIILAVGRIAAQNLLATDTPLARLRGRVHFFGARGTPLIVTYHPAYLLRSPGEKRKAWEDLKFARATAQGLG